MDRAEAEAIYDAGREACVEFLVELSSRYERQVAQLEERIRRLEEQLREDSRYGRRVNRCIVKECGGYGVAVLRLRAGGKPIEDDLCGATPQHELLGGSHRGSVQLPVLRHGPCESSQEAKRVVLW